MAYRCIFRKSAGRLFNVKNQYSSSYGRRHPLDQYLWRESLVDFLHDQYSGILICKIKQILDRMSPSFREYLEPLTCEHNADFFHEEARKLGLPLNKGPRGSPLNVDDSLKASHPVIRTNRKLI